MHKPDVYKAKHNHTVETENVPGEKNRSETTSRADDGC